MTDAPTAGVPATDAVVAARAILTPRFVVVVSSGLLYFTAVAMMVPVLPHYVEDSLRGNSVGVGVAVLAFSVGAITLRLYAGRIGDRTGRRVLIIVGALVVGAATLSYGVVHALWWLVLMRVVTGFGEAGFFVGAATMVTDLAPAERLGEAISYWSIAVYGGLSFGPALGDFLRGTSRFELTFVVSAALAGAAACVGLFTVEVARGERTAAPAQLLNRAAIGPGTVMFLGLIPLAGFSAFVPLYTDELHTRSGPILLLYGVLILVVRIVGARLPDTLGGRRAASLALTLAAAGIGIAAAWASVAGLVTGTVVLAAGMSLMYPALFVIALSGASESERASVVATISSFFDASQGLGAFVCGAVVVFAGNRGAFWTGAVCALAGLALLRARTP